MDCNQSKVKRREVLERRSQGGDATTTTTSTPTMSHLSAWYGTSSNVKTNVFQKRM